MAVKLAFVHSKNSTLRE